MTSNNYKEAETGFPFEETTTTSSYANINDVYIKHDYKAIFPSGIDIFDEVIEKIDRVKNVETKKLSKIIINKLASILYAQNQKNNIENFLKQMHLTEMEDESALIEWNFNNFRIGFSIEPEINQSSYYIVNDDKLTGEYNSRSGYIKEKNLDSFVTLILQFVLRNT